MTEASLQMVFLEGLKMKLSKCFLLRSSITSRCKHPEKKEVERKWPVPSKVTNIEKLP